MKKTNNKSPMKRIAASATMLAVSAAMLGTSTYAWFTMNKKVTVTGMEMHTKVSENLLIAGDSIGSTKVKDDKYFNNSLVQLAGGLIEPVSTVNGKNFFYTAGTNVQGNGDVLNKEWEAYNASNTDDFLSAYALDKNDALESTAVGYVDYVYQLKAINGSTASEIRLTGLDLTYGGTGDNGQKATRIAVFAENLGYKTGSDSSSNLIDSQGTVDNANVVLKAIYTPASAVNFDSGKAVSDVDERSAVTYNEKFVLPVGTNQTQYYKIIVRVWLEGEDNTCNNTTFMDLTDKWAVDMKWDFVATATADSGDNAKVAGINSTVSTGKIALTTGQDVADTAAYTISGIPYYEITGKALNSKQLYTTDTTLTTSSRVFTISSDGLYPTEVTNQVTITAGN